MCLEKAAVLPTFFASYEQAMLVIVVSELFPFLVSSRSYEKLCCVIFVETPHRPPFGGNGMERQQ